MSSLFHPSLLSNCIGSGSVDCRDSSFLSLKNKRLLVNQGLSQFGMLGRVENYCLEKDYVIED